jgi:hypothetical protein
VNILRAVKGRRIGPRACGALAAGLVFVGQYLTVSFNYRGDWSSLFQEGALYPAAPQLEWEHHYKIPDSLGYDGQLYHLVAHDPLMQGDLQRYVDAPRLRYRRILVPLAAYLLALGYQPLIDVAYRAVVLFFVFLGAYWCARYATLAGRSAAWGLAFVLFPAVVVSAEKMTVDVALAALTAGFAVHARRPESWRLRAVLSLAGLARETGVLFALVTGGTAACRRQTRRAILALATLLPAVLWFVFVHFRTDPYDYHNSFVPLSGVVRAFLAPEPPPVVQPGQVGEWWRITLMCKPNLDRLALLGAVAAFGLAAVKLRRAATDPLALSAALFALLGVLVQRPDNWLHVYDYGRVYSPLLLLLALRGLEKKDGWTIVPLLAMWPRICVELAMQAVGALRGLARMLLG